MILAFVTGAIALLLSLAATPVARRLAIACGMTDVPGGRRIHLRPIPRGGGLAVVAAAVGASALCAGMPPGLGISVLGGGLLLLVVGVADDAISLSPKAKLGAQAVAATMAVAGGVRLSLLDPASVGSGPLLEAALTVVWIVLITNAVNLTDGLDGLASGIGIIACGWLACAAVRGGDPGMAIAPLALGGALLGFLAYNFNPATIFLGDAGSLTIGYAMAVLPLVGDGGRGMPPLAAGLLVAFPMTDTVLAIARRFVSRCVRLWGEGLLWRGVVEGLRNTVAPDRRHIHHRLLDLGFSQRRAVLLVYLATATTGALSYVVAESPGWPVDLFAVGLGVSVIAIVQALGIDELQPVRSGVFLPLWQRLAGRRWLLVAVDTCLVVVIYGGALLLVGPGARKEAVGAALALMVLIQLATFAILGVYRAAWRAAGIGGVGILVRSSAGGAVGGYVALRLLGLPTAGSVAFLYFCLFLCAVTVIRFSYVLLLHAAQDATAAEPTLICGTTSGIRGALVRLSRAGKVTLKPVGFVEFRPQWQGRQLDQLPVVGTLDGLPRMIREQAARHLIIADPALRGEALAWVRAVCRQYGVTVHRYVEKFVSCDESIGRLRRAQSLASAWEILGVLFQEIGVDGCALSLGNGCTSAANGAGKGTPGAGNGTPGAGNGADGAGDESSKGHSGANGGGNGTNGLGYGANGGSNGANGRSEGRNGGPREIYVWRGMTSTAPRVATGRTPASTHGVLDAVPGVNGNGGGNGNGAKTVTQATVFRHDGDCWRPVPAKSSHGDEILTLPVRCKTRVWGALLVTTRAGNRLITAAERSRLRRAAMVLGERMARWSSPSTGRGPGVDAARVHDGCQRSEWRTDEWS